MAVSLRAKKQIVKKSKMAEEKEVKNEQEMNQEEVNETPEQKEVNETPEQKELTAEDKFNELNEKYIRIHAEFDNYRKRTNKEKLDLISTANSGVLTDLLPIFDDFERAIANNDSVEDIESIREGFKLIFNKFKGTLESKGLKPMEVDGQDFDSELHEAIANIPAPSKKLKGKVIEAVEKGYYLNDKVIRYAKVVVGQ